MRKTGVLAWLQYVAIRGALTVMQMFPLEWNLATARVLARWWMRLWPRHRDRAQAHLATSLGDTYTPDEIRALAERSLESLVMFAVESICMPRLINQFTWPQYFRLLNFEKVLDLMIKGKGLILVTGHYGSFELTGHLVASLGFRIAAVMRPLDNVYLNRMLVETRRIHGLTLLDKKGAMAAAESMLQDAWMLGFIGDQDAGRKGLFVDFFGRPASTYKSIGLLAMSTERPIAVGYVRRRGNRASYEVGTTRLIMPKEWADRSDPLHWITQEFTSAIEAIVREDPTQYLWIHRRWKSQPGKKRKKKAVGGEPQPDPSPARAS